MDQEMTDDSERNYEPEINDVTLPPGDTDNGLHSTQRVSRASHINVHGCSLDHQEARWQRLSNDYNEQYLDLFVNDRSPEDIDKSLNTSQYGSVTWTSHEKEKLFSALAKKGRHNLPDLAATIVTKSVVEVRDYLGRLKAAEAEHQMFAPHAKNVSLAEIDAAVEINEELEGKLEQAADALAVFQDKYDLAKARGNGGLWLIDTATAKMIDDENDQREGEETDASPNPIEPGDNAVKAFRMFQFGTMLELSRSIFMNPADESEHHHWTECAEEGEEPSVTVDAARILYNLTKSLVQRILQTSIFLAKSRIRSTTTSDYTPAEILKDVDVVAALNVLNMPVDVWDYWTTFARRSGVRVILGDHRKGQNETLTLEQVEMTLSVRSSRGRHRSLSSIVSQSSREHQSHSESEMEASSTTAGLSQSIEAEANQDASVGNSDADLDLEHTLDMDDGKTMEEDEGEEEEEDDDDDDDEEGEGQEEEEEEGEEANDDNSDIVDPTTHGQRIHISRKRRRIMMEESQDEFLEKLDHASQVEEEHRLQAILGASIVKAEPSDDIPRRPRGQRKTKHDLRDWSEGPYHSYWERRSPRNPDLEQQSEVE